MKNTAKPKHQLKKSNLQRLLLGLTFALAASLCVLEYGKPLAAKFITTGLDDEAELLVDPDLPPLTFPKEKPKPEVVRKTKPSTTFEIVKEEVKTVAEAKPEEMPEFEFNDDLFFSNEVGVAPDLVLESWMLDRQPEFEGGQKALLEYVQRRVKYPARLMERGIQGRVMVEFIVDRKGKVKAAKVIDTPDRGFNATVISVVSSMPDWKPGKKNGRNVDVTMRLPVVFSLAE